ncbi:MAG: hypothetical protein QME82_05445 [Bacillota bacterium]|nr:hypothetical protein [Bacillota bacterium]
MVYQHMAGSRLEGTWAVVKTELRMRARSWGFWFLVLVFSVLTRLALPPRTAGYAFLTAAHHGAFTYDSNFVGTVSGFVSTPLFGLVGFFIAHNSMRRDRITPAGEILASTRLASPAYLFGKYLAAVFTLGALLAASMATAVVVQRIRGESVVAWGPLLISALTLAAPTLLYTAGLGVAAGSLPGRGYGTAFNLLYVAYWFATLWGALTISFVRTALWVDFTGFVIPSFVMASSQYHASVILGAAPPTARLLQWPTLDAEFYLPPRLAYAALGPVLVALSLLWFRRFDPSQLGPIVFARSKKSRGSGD